MSSQHQDQQTLLELLDNPGPSAEPLPSPGSELAIYGAGQCGRDVLRALRARGHRVAAFLDARAAALGTVEGVPCATIDSAAARRLADAQTTVIIGVFNYRDDAAGIAARLRQAGFERVVSYGDLFEQMPEQLRFQFWLEPRERCRAARESLMEVLHLWDDPISRDIFLQALRLRLRGDLQVLRRPLSDDQYLPPDLPSPAQPMRLVDGGAFVGDTLESFLAHGVRFAALAAFEPDPSSFRQLCRVASLHRQELGEAILLPCGLGAATAMHAFSAGQGGGSALADHGQTTVQLVKLDEALGSFAPTFIKLDVEGAELDALEGAEATIRACHPRLAVSVYHVADHLWRIPLLLRRLLPASRLVLRYHQYNGFDMVAYAIEP